MSTPRTWISINRAALISNISNVSQYIGKSCQIIPVVKANAYGHGLSQVVKALPKSHFWGFGMASGDEALALRELTPHPILVMSSWEVHELPALLRSKLELVVWDEPAARHVIAAARKAGERARVHVKIDTGATRIGVLPERVPSLMRLLTSSRWVRIAGIFSHFADSEAKQTTGTLQQLARFEQASQPWAETIPRHMACTASLRFPRSHFDFVRLGIGLYGIWPSPATESALRKKIRFAPVLSWYTRLQQLKWVPAGTTVGYARTWRAKQRTLVGILPIGYADGFPRSHGNVGSVLVGGKRRPVIGRVCMNLIMIDCTDPTRPQVGDTATMVGRDGRAEITANEFAAWGSTIAHEAFTRLHPSIPRLVV